MSQYVGVGDDLKKEQLKSAKEAARQAAIAKAKAMADIPGGSVDLPAVGEVPTVAIAAVVLVAAVLVGRKLKKRG